MSTRPRGLHMPTLPSLRNLPSLAIDLDSNGSLELSALSDSLQDDLISPNELSAIVDSAYVNARVNRSLFLDSNEAIALIDSSYVQARQNFIDSPTIQSIIDSVYMDGVLGYKYLDSIEAKTLTDPLYMDSIEVVSLVDSTYVQNRVDFTGYATEVYVDSNIGVAVSALVNGADASFDTLKEIQDAMATDSELTNAINGLFIPSKTSEITNDGTGTGETFIHLPYNISNFTNDANYLDSSAARNVIESEDLDLGSNKVVFSNAYNSTADFPPSISHQGMFVYDVTTNLAYYGGKNNNGIAQWIEIADEETPVSAFSNDANYLDSAGVENAEFNNINATQITLGDWTISTDANGDLNFTHATRGLSLKLDQSADVLIAKGDITAFGDL